MSDETATQSHNGPDHIKERSTNKKTPDYVTRARRTRQGGGVDMSTCPPPGPDVHPSEPEPIGPLAAKYLDQIAAQQADDDLAARRREALNRLRRQQPAIRTRHHEEPR